METVNTQQDKGARDAPGIVSDLIRDGYVIARNVVPANVTQELRRLVEGHFDRLIDEYGMFDADGNSNVLKAVKSIETVPSVKELIDRTARSPRLLDTLESLLGPDISANADSTFILNDPRDTSSITRKPLHQEYWTGALSDDLTVWMPITPIDAANTLNVVPGSHYFGVLPNRNRQLLEIEGFAPGPSVTIDDIGPGDALIFHCLLLHGSAGRSNKRRIALTRIYRPTFAPMSRKMLARGTVPLRQGALSSIRDALGNDAYTPLRSYGGATSNMPELFDMETGPDST